MEGGGGKEPDHRVRDDDGGDKPSLSSPWSEGGFMSPVVKVVGSAVNNFASAFKSLISAAKPKRHSPSSTTDDGYGVSPPCPGPSNSAKRPRIEALEGDSVELAMSSPLVDLNENSPDPLRKPTPNSFMLELGASPPPLPLDSPPAIHGPRFDHQGSAQSRKRKSTKTSDGEEITPAKPAVAIHTPPFTTSTTQRKAREEPQPQAPQPPLETYFNSGSKEPLLQPSPSNKSGLDDAAASGVKDKNMEREGDDGGVDEDGDSDDEDELATQASIVEDEMSMLEGMAGPDLRSAINKARARLRACLQEGYVPDAGNPPVGLEKKVEQIKLALEQPLKTGRSSGSFLVMGPNGCGKTLSLEYAFKELRRDNPRSFHVIRLDGSTQLSDRAAISEIAWQLGLKDPKDNKKTVSMNAAQQLEYIIERLKNDRIGCKTFIFVVDNVNEFAHKTKQTLLYSLLDLQHTQGVNIITICVSTVWQVVEQFEKRVKSRMSSTKILYGYHPFGTMIRMVDRFMQLPPDTDVGQPYTNAYNLAWRKLHQSRGFRALLHRHHGWNKPPRWFANLCNSVTFRLNEKHPFPRLDDFEQEVKRMSLDMTSIVRSILPGSCNLDLLVLGAMARLHRRGPHEYCNFEQIWNEYEVFLRKNPTAPYRYSKNLLIKGLLHVLESGLVELCHSIPPGGPAYFKAGPVRSFKSLQAAEFDSAHIRLAFSPDDLVDCLKDDGGVVDCPTLIQRWATHWTV